MNLKEIAKEINEILDAKRKELKLTFTEDNHEYTMIDKNGKLRTDFPSVSKVYKVFYDEFPREEVSFRMSRGVKEEQNRLLEMWDNDAQYACDMGSRVHFILEKETLSMNGVNKEVRQPSFTCNREQETTGDKMIIAGKNYLHLMKERGLVLLDTEMVLGDNELGYTGQPDKVWLSMNREGNEVGIVITDWKTNKPKNMEVNDYTEPMKPPFEKYPGTALSHYYLQLPLYGRLLLKMLKGTPYENIKFYGAVVVHLNDFAEYTEYRVPKDVITKIMEINLSDYLTK